LYCKQHINYFARASAEQSRDNGGGHGYDRCNDYT